MNSDATRWRETLGPLAQRLEQEWLPAWLPTRRWYQGKSRAIQRVELLDGSILDDSDGSITLLIMVGVATSDGAMRLYQVPILMFSGHIDLQTLSPAAIVGQSSGTSEQPPIILVDALTQPIAAVALLQFIDANSKLVTECGTVTGSSTRAFDSLSHGELEPVRLSGAEQSHSNVIFGDQLLLKVFREQSPGQNPDIEILRFLTERTTFRNMPELAGSLRYEAENLGPWSTYTSDSAMLQQFVPSRGQGWEYILKLLADYYGATFSGKHSAIEQTLEATRRDVERLARRTAELHQALSSIDDDPNFAPEPFNADDWHQSAAAIRKQLAITAKSLEHPAEGCPSQVVDRAKSVLQQVPTWLERHEREVDIAQLGRKHRIHGDLHLGQTLRIDDDFLFLDFEGEPSKSIDERRRKQSPLRDVAGMIRSFDYAAHAALDASADRYGSDPEMMAEIVENWSRDAATRFLNVYTQSSRKSADPLPPARQALFERLLVEKALYELDYELNNRPTWASIPLRGLAGLV